MGVPGASRNRNSTRGTSREHPILQLRRSRPRANNVDGGRTNIVHRALRDRARAPRWRSGVRGRQLSAEGARKARAGHFGMVRGLDYTQSSRVPEAPRWARCAYMAHHQAMSIVAISNALTGGIMRRRFHAEPIIRATELLLQERMPRDIAVARPPGEKVRAAERIEYLAPEIQRRYTTPH